MTNFSGSSRSGLWSWLSPERAVLVVPVLAGLGLAVLIFSLGVTPLSLKNKEQEKKVALLRAKSELIPLLRSQLRELEFSHKERQLQLDRLLGLVAGTTELDTFLAKINDLAISHGVFITTTEPGPYQQFIPPKPEQSTGSPPPAALGSLAAKPSSDALLYEGIEKRSAGLQVIGSFEKNLDFLRSLERLQLVVIIEDLEIQVQNSGLDKQNVSSTSTVIMNAKLTAYGRSLRKAALGALR